MKIIRLLYPDYVSGGLETYYFGANLLQHILPENKNQSIIKVDIQPPNENKKKISNGIYEEDQVLNGIAKAYKKLEEEKPDKIITIGGNCLVSLPSFDYLHGKYENIGMIWIDAHPDITTLDDGYPYAHAMVLGSLLGKGAPQLREKMKNKIFKPEDILYIGLQPIHDYQKKYLDEIGVKYKIQDKEFISDNEIKSFVSKYKNSLVHFDIDVLDEHLFHSTYFANPELKGDGSSGGKMTIEKLGEILKIIENVSDVVGFTIAEYLPFDEFKLHKMFKSLKIFSD